MSNLTLTEFLILDAEMSAEQQLQAEFEAKMKAFGYSEAALRRSASGAEYYFSGVELDYQRFKDGVK